MQNTMSIRGIASFVAVAVLAVTTTTAPTAAQPVFDRIVVFGTSLSDSGNAFALLGESSTPPDFLLDPFLIPSAPYARGGHHFSNGATWVEQFARSQGLAGSTRPALLQLDSVASNYAVGAARAREDGIDFNLSEQVSAYLQRSGGVASGGALFAIEMGSNDVRDAFLAYAGGNPAQAFVILQDAYTAIANNIATLYAAGARTFLLWRVPNVALTPAARSLGPGAIALGTQLTQGFNSGLDAAAAQLSQLPGITIVRLDVYQLLNEIVADPQTFGLTNVTTACLTPNVPPFTCDRPDEFLFWDGIHPTSAGHALIAADATASLPH